MGRYYNGDIEGKFMFARQPSDDADFFGQIGEPNEINYHFQKEKKVIQTKVEELLKTYPTPTTLSTGVYQLAVCIDYKSLLDKIILE